MTPIIAIVLLWLGAKPDTFQSAYGLLVTFGVIAVSVRDYVASTRADDLLLLPHSQRWPDSHPRRVSMSFIRSLRAAGARESLCDALELEHDGSVTYRQGLNEENELEHERQLFLEARR